MRRFVDDMQDSDEEEESLFTEEEKAACLQELQESGKIICPQKVRCSKRAVFSTGF